MTVNLDDVVGAVGEVAASWTGDRSRLARRSLDSADFAALRGAGLLGLAVPGELGGAWQGIAATRPLLETYRRLARADPSVALVSSMHPAVLSYWAILSSDDRAWTAQCEAVAASALAGEQWGTITSEPGSGGDIMKTTATAAPRPEVTFLPGDGVGITGDKHFGSGSGMCDRMVTTARVDGDDAPSIFVLDTTERAWDGTAGFRLLAEWDGMGMSATQSHALRLDGAPAVRLAWPGALEVVTLGAAPFIATLFTAVVLGVLDEAVATARTQLAGKADQLRAYEQVEWSRAELDHWLAQQAYEGAVRALEAGDPARALHAALRAKQGVAELAESTLQRLSRVLGGGTFSERSPFAHWFEDVRALGFLRPPWGLAYDNLFLTSFTPIDG